MKVGSEKSLLARLGLNVLKGALFMAPIWLCAFIAELVLGLSQHWLGPVTSYLVKTILPGWLYAGYFPDANIPGLSLITLFCLLALLGKIASFASGRKALGLVDRFFKQIPGISGIYSALRKMLSAVEDAGQTSFRKVVLLQWPGPGIKAVGFLTNEIGEGETKKYAVFIPHIPNPTSGFVVIVDAALVEETEMSLEEGIRFCLSLGVLAPDQVAGKNKKD